MELTQCDDCCDGLRYVGEMQYRRRGPVAICNYTLYNTQLPASLQTVSAVHAMTYTCFHFVALSIRSILALHALCPKEIRTCMIACSEYLSRGCQYCLFVSVSLSVYFQQHNSESCWRHLVNFFGWVGCVTRNSWLDFTGDPDDDVDTGIFKRMFLYCCEIGQFYKFCQ